jgi:hypothetical protein
MDTFIFSTLDIFYIMCTIITSSLLAVFSLPMLGKVQLYNEND